MQIHGVKVLDFSFSMFSLPQLTVEGYEETSACLAKLVCASVVAHHPLHLIVVSQIVCDIMLIFNLIYP